MPGIYHQIIDKPTDLLGVVSQNLIDLGAVYVNNKRATKTQMLVDGDYVRIFSEPKRYPVDKIDWLKTIIFEDDNLILIDKPYGIPVHPTLDNTQENVLIQLGRAYGGPLYHTHRLDVGTQGLLIFTKNQGAQTEINNLFLNRQVKKFYRARTLKPLTPGPLVHYMQPSKRSPKILSAEPLPEYKNCELLIHHNGEIELITGRTHQIRAQLSFERNPIIGDILYGGAPTPPPNYNAEFFYLACVRLELSDGRKFTRPEPSLERAGEASGS